MLFKSLYFNKICTLQTKNSIEKNKLYLFFYYNQLMHNYLTEVYITAVFCVIYASTCFDNFV